MAQRNDEIEEQRERFMADIRGRLVKIVLSSTAAGVLGTVALDIAKNADERAAISATSVFGVGCVYAIHIALRNAGELCDSFRCYLTDPRKYFKKYHGNQEF